VSGLRISVSSVVTAISGALAALVLTIRCHLMVQGFEWFSMNILYHVS
jgi:hypothetical protein